jgi:cytochrome P450
MDPDIYESPQDFNPSRWDNVSGVLRYVKHFFSSNYLVHIMN